jgi:hypothetical protein
LLLCRLIKEHKAHTLWLDNFSKIRAMQFPDLELGAWQDCCWTGYAVRESRIDVDMSIRMNNETKEIEPAMPHHIYEMYPTLKQAFLVYNEPTAECPSLYSDSLTTLLGVSNVPLKPSHLRLSKPEHKQAVHEGHDSLDNCFPEGIVATNIGSNKGLLQLMRNHYESVCVTNVGKRYSCLNVDSNIFDRILKVKTQCRSSKTGRMSLKITRPVLDDKKQTTHKLASEIETQKTPNTCRHEVYDQNCGVDFRHVQF